MQRLGDSAIPATAAVDLVLLVLPGVIWGASFLFIAEGLRAMGPNGVAFSRIAIGFATLSVFPGAHRPVNRADWPLIVLLGVLWFAFPMSMLPFAEQRISSALTGMLNGATPIFAATCASLIAWRVPSLSVVAAVAVGFAGAVLMAVPDLDAGGTSTTGVVLVLLALVSYGVALNMTPPLQLRNGALPVIWRSLAVAVACTAPLGVTDVLHAHWSWRAALSLAALGALGTGFANVLVTVAAGRMGATKASATAFLIPVVALVLGIVVLGEHVAVVSIVGAAVCLAGAWMLRQSQSS